MKKSRRKYEQQLGLKSKSQQKLFVAHVRWNRNLRKNIMGFTYNEGETIFTPSAQAEFLKDFYSSVFREPTPTLPVPSVVMPVPQFSIPVVHRELSSLDISKGAGLDDIYP